LRHRLRDMSGKLARPEWQGEAYGTGCYRFLMWNMNYRLAKKPVLCNILRRFAGFCPGSCSALELGFVNHARLVFQPVCSKAFAWAAAAACRP
jgi:hypothetical protein